ncbi:MAG: NAD-dependent epimerase/dehydratase family protein [Thermoproteota archaeon]
METDNILVTGGAGFMGSWLVDELLNRGHGVISVDNLLGGYMSNVNKDCFLLKRI